MDCGAIRELLLEYDGALDRLDAPTRAHVESCPLCVQQADLLRRFSTAARRAPRPALPPNFTFRVMERLRAEEAARIPAWRRILRRAFAPRLAPAFGLAALVALALGLWLLLPPPPGGDPVADTRQTPPAPPVAPALPAPTPDPGARQVAESRSDFTLEGKPLAYASYMTLPRGVRIDYRPASGGAATVEIVESANLMFVEGEFQLVEGAVRVASNGRETCKLVGATETARVAMTGTVFDLSCRNGVTCVSCSRGKVAVRTIADESFILSAGDAARVGVDGRRMAASAGSALDAGADLPAGPPAYSLSGSVEVGAGDAPAGRDALPVKGILDTLQNNGIGR